MAPSPFDDTVEVLSDEVIHNLPNLYDIHGTIWWEQPDLDTYLESFVARLEAAGSAEEFDRNFYKEADPSPKRQPVPDVVVTLQGNSVTRRTVTDAEGRFQFPPLLYGEYELFAEEPARSSRTGEERMTRARQRVNLDRERSFDLKLRADLASVRGRITDVAGRPVAGAKVTGIEVIDDPGHMFWPREYSTVSNIDGSYELQSLVPTDFFRTMRYLISGSPGSLQHYDIRVEADGFVQSKENVSRVPLVTGEGLYWARRILRAFARHSEEDLREKEDLSLPSIQGNTITGIDVLLTRVEH